MIATEARTYDLRETLMKIENLSLELGGKMILRDINLEIRNIVRPNMAQGQVIGFLGPSGRGKTQLFLRMAGLEKPTTGNVWINVNNQAVEVTPGLVGVVPQNYILFENRTVLGNLTIAAMMKGRDRKTAKEKSMEYLERFKLVEHAKFYPGQLSGGQRQRVAIARQLLCSEHYLLMDEPFSGLDHNMKQEVAVVINKIATDHELNTIVIITHDIPTAISVSDHLWVLGFDYDAQGKPLKEKGSTMQEIYDLIDRDLCWHPDVSQMPKFRELVAEIETRFKFL